MVLTGHAQSIESPNRQLNLTFHVDNGIPYYSLLYKGKIIIEKSRLGFEMKNIKSFMITILVGILSLFGLYTNVLAETAPKTFKTKDPVILTDYIEGAPKVHYKEIDGGILVYCQNETLVYQGRYTMKLYSQVDDGFIYILENRPNTGDKYKDYYAMQIAIWWYEDLLNNNNANIPQDVKVSILRKINTDTYSRIIYNLVSNAKKYKQDKINKRVLTKEKESAILYLEFLIALSSYEC